MRCAFLLLVPALLTAADDPWKAFGERVIQVAPDVVKRGSQLEKARYITHMVANRLAAEGIPPNADFMGRVRAVWQAGARRIGRGSCGDMAGVLEASFRGAGITADLRGIEASPKGIGAYNRLDVNRNHGALALVEGGVTYLFDPWQYGKGGDSFAGMGLRDRWNGMPFDTWQAEMKRQGYGVFTLEDGGDVEAWRVQKAGEEEARKRVLAGSPKPGLPTRPDPGPKAADGTRTAEERELLACFKAWAEDGLDGRNRDTPGADYRIEWNEGPRLEGDKVIFAYSMSKNLDGRPGRQVVFQRGAFDSEGRVQPGKNWFSVGEVRGLCQQYKSKRR